MFYARTYKKFAYPRGDGPCKGFLSERKILPLPHGSAADSELLEP